MIRLKRLYANDFKQLKEIELNFPDTGRILVQGRNEAGKSTLFEAIFFALFGQPLLTEAGSRGLPDVIGYGMERCRVELDVEIRGRVFRIERGVRMTRKRDKNTGEEKREGQQHGVALTIVANGEPARVEGIRTVDDTLVRELGFDAEALLNTCFVEQKKLDKLETTTRKDREQALAKLLNLDALVNMEDELKVSREEEKTLDRLRERWDLARAYAQLPPVEDELARVEQALNRVELKRQLLRAAEEARALTALSVELNEWYPRVRELEARAERAQQLRDALNEIKNAVTALETHAQQHALLERERAEAEERARQDLQDAPRVERRIQDGEMALRRSTRLDRVETIRFDCAQRLEELHQQLTQLEKARGRQLEIEKQIGEERERVSEFDARLRDYRLGAALDAWVQAMSVMPLAAESPENLNAKQTEREKLDARMRLDLLALGATLVAGSGISFAVPVVFLLSRFDIIPAFVLSGTLLLVTLFLVVFLIRRALSHYRALTRLAEEIGRLEKQDEAARAIREANKTRVEEAKARFVALGIPPPRDASFAQAQRVQLASKLAGQSEDEFNRAREDAQVGLRALERELTEVSESQMDSLRSLTGDERMNSLTASIAVFEKTRTRTERVLTNYPRSPEFGATAEIERALDRARLELEALRRRQTSVTQQAVQFESRSRMLAQMLDPVGEMRARAEQWSGISAPALGDSLSPDSLRAYGKQVQDEYARLGGAKVSEEAKQASAIVAAKQGEIKAHGSALGEVWRTAHEVAEQLKIEYPSEFPGADSLEQWANELDAPNDDERNHYDRHAKKLREERGRLKGTIQQLDLTLALGGEILDEPAARSEYEHATHEHEVRKRARDISERARRRVMQKVLPATMDYMRRLLPQLTRERYHDAELDPESYKIKVWDERGQMWKDKNIFSGGTKDQFSLALRLAFALATLPQERNTAPGFIFLDEPLSAFDDERADALINLLTDGEISRAFDQIFLISHIRVRQDRFTHRVVMENGRVVESNL